MAERIVRQLIDDVDGTEIPDGGGESVEFSVRGVTYRIDLSAGNVAKFDKALKPFVDAASKVGGARAARKKSIAGKASTIGSASTNGKSSANGKSSSNGKVSGEQIRAIRDWARRNGHAVSARGRIKAEVVEAFEAAH
jgi:nucleoid-associated protein Lsr2